MQTHSAGTDEARSGEESTEASRCDSEESTALNEVVVMVAAVVMPPLKLPSPSRKAAL